MRKAWSIVLSLLLCPLSALAQKAETPAGTAAVSADFAPSFHAELRVKPVRELEAETAKELARAGLQPMPLQRSTPWARRLTAEGAGKAAIGVGAGLAAVGVILAATAYETKTVTEPIFIQGPGYTITGSQTYTTSGTSMGKRWGGIAVAGAGGALIVYGILKIR